MGRPSTVAFSRLSKGASPKVLATRARQSASVAGGKSPTSFGARVDASDMARNGPARPATSSSRKGRARVGDSSAALESSDMPGSPTTPLLSLCLATYNRARYLDRYLTHHLGALGAAGIDYELVVSDNCSTDETPQILA